MLVHFFSFLMVGFATIGFARGFLKESLGLLGIFILFYILADWSEVVAKIFSINTTGIGKILFNIFFALVVFIFVSVCNSMISKALKNIHFNLFTDHFLGIFIGALKGFVVAMLITIPFAVGLPAIEENAEKFELTLPEEIKYKDSLFVHFVSATQRKFLKIADVEIDQKINDLFESLFVVKDKKEIEKEDADKKNTKCKGDNCQKTLF